jgi:hypothetical protein
MNVLEKLNSSLINDNMHSNNEIIKEKKLKQIEKVPIQIEEEESTKRILNTNSIFEFDNFDNKSNLDFDEFKLLDDNSEKNIKNGTPSR